MNNDKNDDQAVGLNVVSNETGQFDARFLLWRTFCSEHGVPVDALPSELEGEVKEKWEKVKDDQLQEAVEQQAAPPPPPVSN